jgi:hypothetical protein
MATKLWATPLELFAAEIAASREHVGNPDYLDATGAEFAVVALADYAAQLEAELAGRLAAGEGDTLP